jgi:DNA-binding transcriptional ArsR family regulator
MAMLSIDELGIPLMRGNPFSLRPIEAEEAEALIGRRDILREWNEHIRSNSPRLIALYGERGSGRTSLLQAAATWTPNSHHAHIWPDTDVVATVLTELFVSFADFEAPHSTELVGSRLVEILARIEGPLPLIAFDHPSAHGPELASMLLRILPILHRLRALCIVTVTPAQYSSWSQEVRDAFDISGPLNPFTAQEVASLIENRFRTVSTNGWRPDSSFISAVLHRTGGQPAAVIRLLRDIVDIARGVRSTPIESFFNIEDEKELLSTGNGVTSPIQENIQNHNEVTDNEHVGRHFDSEQSILQLQPNGAFVDESEHSSSGRRGLGSRSGSVVERATSSADFRDPWDPVDVAGRPLQSSRLQPESMMPDISQTQPLDQGVPLQSGIHQVSDNPNRGISNRVSGGTESVNSGYFNRLKSESNALRDSLEASDSSIGIERGEEDWQSEVFGEDDEKPIFLEEQRSKIEGIDQNEAFSPFAEWGDVEENDSDAGFEGGENHELIDEDDISTITGVQNPEDLSESEPNSEAISSPNESLEHTGSGNGSRYSAIHSVQSDVDGAGANVGSLDVETTTGNTKDGPPNVLDSIPISDKSTSHSEITASAEDLDSSVEILGSKDESSHVKPDFEQAATDAENSALFQSRGIGRSSIGGSFSALADRSRGNISSRDGAKTGAPDLVKRTRIRPTGPIQAKPNLDVANTKLDGPPVHIFNGGALWVDDASREEFESLSNPDSKEKQDEKADQPFTLPLSSTTADSDRQGSVDSSINPTFYRSQDGTSLLEIQDGCTPPSLRRNASTKPPSDDTLDAAATDVTHHQPVAADAVTTHAAAQNPSSLDRMSESAQVIEGRNSEKNLDAEFSQPDDYQLRGSESIEQDSEYDSVNFELAEEIEQELTGRRGHIHPTRERVEAESSAFGDLKSRLKGLREPRWEPDISLDHLRLRALSNHEILVIEAAVSREISPSDQRLQARLQVGRSRLSQIYNGLYRAGILSARKEGRLRYFKLSNGAIEHLEGAV